MSAPTRKPWFGDAIGGLDQVDDPIAEATFIIDNFASTAKSFPDWIGDDLGLEVRLTVVERVPAKTVIDWVAGGASGTIEFSLDPSGWILAVGKLGEVEVARGYIEHIYEAYEIYPPGMRIAGNDESPGRFGKKMHWVGLSPQKWPALLPLARDGGIVFSVDDSKLR